LEFEFSGSFQFRFNPSEFEFAFAASRDNASHPFSTRSGAPEGVPRHSVVGALRRVVTPVSARRQHTWVLRCSSWDSPERRKSGTGGRDPRCMTLFASQYEYVPGCRQGRASSNPAAMSSRVRERASRAKCPNASRSSRDALTKTTESKAKLKPENPACARQQPSARARRNPSPQGQASSGPTRPRPSTRTRHIRRRCRQATPRYSGQDRYSSSRVCSSRM
jgi:hypothetical protein